MTAVVIRVDVPFEREGHGGRLFVRALAEAHTGSRLHRAVDIGLRAMQVALQDNADVLRIRRIEAVVEQSQRPLRIGARLHVQPHEGAVVARAGEHLVDDRHTQVFRDIETHRRQLDRHVGVETTLVDAIEQVQIFSARGSRFVLRVDTLAQQVERRGDPLRIELGDGVERLLEGLARDEALGELFRDTVVADEMGDLRLR